MNRPRIVLLYHFFHPDDVVSARQFSDLAVGLTERGYDVLALPCNRTWKNDTSLPPSETWAGGTIRRLWRPGWAQASNRGRILNALWMIAAWTWQALTLPRSPGEVVIIGTDPILSVLVAWPWKLLRPSSCVAHWCFDLYPEAAVADGLVQPNSILAKALTALLKQAYRRCSIIADLGPCMGELLTKYRSQSIRTTITPWALIEPPAVVSPHASVRANLFGSAAKLGLLYSGSFGRAHSYREFLALARQLRGTGIEFCFAGRGNRADELKAAVEPADANVRFAGFAPESELELRLTACDLHLVSLQDEWTGTVVPSKFFGALAVGRAVLFAGSAQSAIAKWINEHRVGWVVDANNLATVALELQRLAENPAERLALQTHCREVYCRHFAKQRQLEAWTTALEASRHANSLIA